MKKLETLTPEDEKNIVVFREKWLNLFYDNQEINYEQAKTQIKWLYKFCSFGEPKIYFMDSPVGCQVLINTLKTDPTLQNVNFDIKQAEEKCYYGDVSDYGWVATYDMIQNMNFFTEYDWTNFNEFKKLLESGIYELYTFDEVCVVCRKPKVTQDDQNRLHNEKGAAVIFGDGFDMFFWHGVNIPSNWILEKSSITRETILEEKNAEKRRCLQEILGSKRFSELLDIEVIDTDKDDTGRIMKLWRSKNQDDLLTEHIYFLECICPSTERTYFICVPEAKNVWGAKAWSFKNEKIQVRHGDVGLVNLEKEFEKPESES